MKEDLVDLARRCAERSDSPCWFRFHGRIERPLRRWVQLRLSQGGGPPSDAAVEDLVQEVFLRLVESRCRVLRRCRASTEAELMAYLREVCASVVTDRWRRQQAQKRVMPTDPKAQAQVGPRCEGSPDPREDPERKAMGHQLRERLCRQVEEVLAGPHARRDREIFELAVLGGWTSREIAAAPSSRLSVAGIDTVVSRVRRRLRQRGVEAPTR